MNTKQYPISKTEYGMYLSYISDPNSLAYNLPLTLKFSKPMDIERLKTAFLNFVENHPNLKSCFVTDEHGNVCRQFSSKAIDIEIVDTDSENITPYVKPFNLETGPCMRAYIFNRPDNVELLFDVHHIIFDGTSSMIFIRELDAAFHGEELNAEKCSAMDFAVGEQELIKSPEFEGCRRYYTNLLDGAEADLIPIPDVDSGKPSSNSIKYELKQITPNEIREFSHKNHVKTSSLFYSVFGYVLSKYTGSENSVFSTVFNGRSEENADAVGMFVKTLPVVTGSVDDNILGYIRKIDNQITESRRHDLFSYADICAELSINPQVYFAYQGDFSNTQPVAVCGQNTYQTLHFMNTLKAELNLILYRQEGKFIVECEYNGGKYSEAFIYALLETVDKTAGEFITKENLSKVDILSKNQLELLDSFNNTEVPYDNTKTVVDMFCEAAKANADKTAVVYHDTKITYGKLEKITRNLAGYLNAQGLGSEDVVAVLIPRGEYMAIASIGVARSGCAYQPLDYTYPQDRLQFMLKDSGAKLLITTDEMINLVPEYNGPVLLIDNIPSLSEYTGELARPSAKDLFILLYTSGSTGVPKGCMLEFGNITAFCHWYHRFYELDNTCHTTAYASYGFDASMMDVFCPLTIGAQLHIIGEEIRLDLMALNDYFEKNQITHGFMTTQVGRQFVMTMENKSLRYFSTGGEKLVPLEPPKGYKLLNLYGPTETTVLVTAFDVDKYYEDIPIGKPLDNLKLYIVDKFGHRMPVGVPGELLISGPQVSRGYLNRPEQTEKVYTENPFENRDEYNRVYHTGDIVRYLPDGNISFVGRRDGQVKIRGFRIELTEIEEVIRRFPGIKDATVTAFEEDGGGKYVAAYIVSDEKIDIDKLNDFITETKPPYMVPAVTMQIDSIPLTQNQKVNKRALPKPEKKAEEKVEPKTEMQKRIFDCVKEAIGHDEFGITTDIYHAGLTSVSAIRLNVLLAKEFDTVIKTGDLKQNPTVVQLEQFLLCAQKAEKNEKRDVYPMSGNQAGVFVDCTANMGTTVYNIPYLMKLDPKVDIYKLKNAIEQTVKAHPYLNATLFMDEDGEFRQRRNDDLPFEVEIISGLNKDELVRPFKLLGERLFRISIHTTSEDNYLFLDLHHLIADGSSFVILLSDINKAYSGESLVPETYTAFDAALDWEKLQNSDAYKKAEDFYASIFGNCGGSTDFEPDKDDGIPSLGVIKISSEKIKHEYVEAICKQYGITENVFFIGAFGAMLAASRNEKKSVFTTIYHGRNDSRLSETVGMLVKTLPVMCDTNSNAKEYFTSLQEQLMGMMDNDVYPFSEINRRFDITPDTMVVYQGDNFEFDTIGGEKAEVIPMALNAAKSPISLSIFLENGKYLLELEYRSDMFEEETANTILQNLEQAVNALTKGAKPADIQLTESKNTKKSAQIYDPTYEFEFEPVTKLFEAQVKAHPDKTAVICQGERLTYSELNVRANRIANALIERGVKRENTVGVLLDRSVNVYAARQGILKSGGAFVVASPEYPEDRVSYILEDSGAKFVLTTADIKASYGELWDKIACKPLLIEEMIKIENDENPDTVISENDLCYCIYTSGSTGKPKGVMIEHGNLANFVNPNPKNHETIGITERASVVLALAAMTFDVSIMEEFIPLTSGLTVVIATDVEIHDLIMLADVIKKNRVDAVCTTPSFLSVMLDIPQTRDALRQVKVYDMGAEAFPGSLYDKVTSVNKDAYIMNGYGPTEATVSCTMKVITSGDSITIGIPNANVFTYIIDDNGKEVPHGQVGELLICGKGVGRGYVNLPERTAEAFIEFRGMRGYKSGDLALINPDGEIEFHGRKDNQVKLRGLRVELGEIEEVVASFPGVTNCAVIAVDNTYLCAYYTAEREISPQELTAYASGKLAQYMVPGVWMQLENMPLTQNRKIDRKALPKPEVNLERADYIPPETEQQKKLCELFEKALGTEKVGIDDDFFALGGTSLAASKVAVMCLNENIPLVYADIFKYPTVRLLTDALYKEEPNKAAPENEYSDYSYQDIKDMIGQNDISNTDDVRAVPIGDILLTGATGFLGIHILKDYIENYDGKAYCLVRKGKYSSPDRRLMNMLMYYFDSPYAELFGDRIICIDGDITDKSEVQKLKDIPFDTLINCAACVKHFTAGDVLEKINVYGVENLIELCKETGKKLIQISTVSVAGEGVDGKPEEGRLIRENDLYFGQVIDNEYIRTKFLAERAVLEAAANGLHAKVIRVGNLMSRQSDGEFQINFITNGFLRTLRGYAAVGKFPMSGMNESTEFSPIDSTAAAVLKAAGTDKQFTVYHVTNNHRIYMSDVIYAMREYGFNIEIVSDSEFAESVSDYAAIHESSDAVSGLIAYSSHGDSKRYYLDYDNRFTTEVLYRLGYKWPITDDKYLVNAISALDKLNFFDDDFFSEK